MNDGLEIRLLGPFEILRGGVALDVGARKWGDVVALLALRAGQVYAVDALWPTHRPDTARNALQHHVARLRKHSDRSRSCRYRTATRCTVAPATSWASKSGSTRRADELGPTGQQGAEEVVRWLSQGPLGLQRDELQQAVDNTLQTLRDNLGRIGRGVVSGATLVAQVVAGILLGIVLVFFFVHDGRRIWAWAVSLAPERHRELTDGAGRAVWTALAGYVRGIAIIAVVDATLIGIALAIIGVPLVLPLSLIVFLGAFIPIVGAFLAGAVAALVALVSGGVTTALLVIAVIVVVIQQLEGDLLYPVIVGRAVRLHGIAILLVLPIGSVFAGLLGTLLAVPVAAAVWTAIAYVREHRAPATGGQ